MKSFWLDWDFYLYSSEVKVKYIVDKYCKKTKSKLHKIKRISKSQTLQINCYYNKQNHLKN